MLLTNDFKDKSMKIWDVIEGPYSAEDMMPDFPDPIEIEGDTEDGH